VCCCDEEEEELRCVLSGGRFEGEVGKEELWA